MSKLSHLNQPKKFSSVKSHTTPLSVVFQINESLNGYALFATKHRLRKSRQNWYLFRKKMSEAGYKIRNQAAIHFITFAVVEWVDVFTRKDYRDILLDSIRYCQKEKDLQVHSWCIMSNHVHFIVSAKNDNLSDVLRDLKKFTSKQIIKAITENKHESRREWMLDIFKKAGITNSRNSEYQFWR